MKLNISTSIKSAEVTDGRDLVKRISDLDIDGMELDYRIRPEYLPGIRKGLRETGLGVSSIHNYFPIPGIVPPRQGSGDFFNMASLDPEECREAVKWTSRSIEHAAEFGAGALVVHGGLVIMEHALGEIKAAFREDRLTDGPVRQLIEKKQDELAWRKPAHLDRLLNSLDRLVRVAVRNNVIIALENRYHYHELPGPDDFAEIFNRFSGAPVGYWHDIGHDHAMTRLGFLPAGSLLERYAGCLAGMHIHDARGLRDHLPPGAGEIDFTPVLSRLGPDVRAVFELMPGTADSEAAEGIAAFRRRLAESNS